MLALDDDFGFKYLVAAGIGEGRLVEHSRYCEEEGALLQSASLLYAAGLLLMNRGAMNEGEDYMNKARPVLDRISPPTRESSLFQLDLLCKLVGSYTESMNEYIAVVVRLLDEDENLKELDAERQIVLISSIKMTIMLTDLPLLDEQGRRFQSPSITDLARDLDQWASRFDEVGLAQMSLSTQSCYM